MAGPFCPACDARMRRDPFTGALSCPRCSVRLRRWLFVVCAAAVAVATAAFALAWLAFGRGR